MVRVFVNHVDSYTGRELSKVSTRLPISLFQKRCCYCVCDNCYCIQVLAGSVVGAVAEEGENGDEADAKPPATSEQSDNRCAFPSEQ